MKKFILSGLILVLLIPFQARAEYPRLYGRYKDRTPPRSYFYPDKYDYGFDPTPPNFKIAPGFRPNHNWRFGAWHYGQGGYSPGYDGIIWFGYEIQY